MTDVHDAVSHPRHYTSHESGVECLELTRRLTFVVGNAVKYVWRADLKNGIEDLEKARFYLRDALEWGDRVFVCATSRTVAVRLLDQIIVYEDGLRRDFFFALRTGHRQSMLAAVEGMLREAMVEGLGR